MKKTCISLSIFILVFLPNLVFCQDTISWPWPWYWMGSEEFIYHTLSVGGWNTLGSFSPRSVGMGETFLASTNASSGYLNPAFLSNLARPSFSMSYRYTENTYKTSFPVGIMPLSDFFGWGEETHSYTRKTDCADSIGLALPFERFSFAGSYFLFQEFNFPEIKGPDYGWLDRVSQSGEMRGINLAFSYRVTPSFSLGISAAYLFGDISRFQSTLTPWVIMDWMQRWSEDPRMMPLDILLWPWPIPSVSDKFDLDLKAFFLNLGLSFEPGEKWLIGLTLRPPFSIDIKAEAERTYDDGFNRIVERSSGDFYMKQPLVAVGSVLYRPLSVFQLVADISVWGWSNISTDYMPDLNYPVDFKNVLKFNLGAEYLIDLPFELIDRLAVRSGYIYDPQPYKYGESFARNFFTAGLGVSVKNFSLDTAAKISISPKELQRFHSNVLQVGASYHF